MASRRFVVLGTGAVGGTIGGLLALAGNEVVAVARGDHGRVLDRDGLTLRRPSGSETVRFAAVEDDVRRVEWRDDDIVIVATKTQDSTPALDALAAAAPTTIAVVCAQNGVENERMALRRFDDVHGMCVMLPATHLEPGVVIAHGGLKAGILDLGRYPRGTDATDDQIAAALSASGFASVPRGDVMRWKYAKLRMNLGNVIEAACGRAARESDLYRRTRDEADRCLAAAGISPITDEEDRARRDGVMTIQSVEGERRSGGSSWQSLARGTGSIETDFLNGEIVLQARLHGEEAPVNAALVQVGRRLAARRAAPASMSVSEIEALIGAA